MLRSTECKLSLQKIDPTKSSDTSQINDDFRECVLVFFLFSYKLAAKWCHITYTCVENYITKQKKKNFLNVKNTWIRTLEAGEQERQKLSSDWFNQIAQVWTVKRTSDCDWLLSARGLSRTCHECTSLAREKHRSRWLCQISPHSDVCGISWYI